MSWCQFIYWLKFETRPSSMRNSKMAHVVGLVEIFDDSAKMHEMKLMPDLCCCCCVFLLFLLRHPSTKAPQVLNKYLHVPQEQLVDKLNQEKDPNRKKKTEIIIYDQLFATCLHSYKVAITSVPRIPFSETLRITKFHLDHEMRRNRPKETNGQPIWRPNTLWYPERKCCSQNRTWFFTDNFGCNEGPAYLPGRYCTLQETWQHILPGDFCPLCPEKRKDRDQYSISVLHDFRNISSQFLLSVPRVNCSTFGGRAFTHAAPVLWNSLPLTIRSSSSTSIFKKRLKTFLFKKAFKFTSDIYFIVKRFWILTYSLSALLLLLLLLLTCCLIMLLFVAVSWAVVVLRVAAVTSLS